MDKHTLKLLEFSKIIENLAKFCFSPLGPRLLHNQRIRTDPQEVAADQALTLAWRKLLERQEQFPQLDFPDLDSYYARLELKGSFLEPQELFQIANFIMSSIRLRRLVLKNAQAENLLAAAGRLPDLDATARDIYKVIDRNGDVKENKIPELVKLKRELTSLRSGVDNLVRKWMGEAGYKNYWQTDTATTRDGRIVLPMKANFKGRIKGIVHEFSASGATVFMEPFDLVEKNNAVQACENNYRKELIKVLRRLTAVVAEVTPELKELARGVAFLDVYFARARYAASLNCHPALPAEQEVQLRNARHPLLKGKVVPLDVTFAPGVRVLIVTGPNTGGKTVSLKTVGLLALMNQFGMQIPADEGSCLPVFDAVLADIGDEQSLEQSLSTFSGHIRNLSRIIGSTTARSLVLLDELGAGTDPEEGVAIAMAILDHFIDKKTLVLSTTHHGILKNYGYTREGVENASMDFDDQTFSPRYRLIMGLPGESHALAIAARNGIPRRIMNQAQAYLQDERSDISELIKRLAEKQKKLHEYEKDHLQRRAELKEKERLSDLKELRLRQKEQEVTEYSLKELRRFLSESRKELENTICQLREEELTRERIKEVHASFAAVEERMQREEKKYTETIKIHKLAAGTRLEAGMQVLVRSNRKTGELLRHSKGGSWLVMVDNVKVTLHPHELEAIVVSGREKEVEVVTSSSASNTPAVFKLNLIGLRLNEALSQLEKQIDAAVISGLKEFNVVHGKGDGILQRGIHDYLKNSPFVSDYYFSTPEEGGFGRTIILLKS